VTLRRSIILMLPLLVLLTAFQPTGRVIYVDDDAGMRQSGSEKYPFADIQQALDLAGNGATVRIAPGYYRSFTIRRPVRLHGAGIDNVRVLNEGQAPSRVINAYDVVIEGLSFIGVGAEDAPRGMGLLVKSTDNLLLLSCKFPYYDTAVYLSDAEATVAATIIEYNRTGVFVDEGVLHASANLVVNNDVGVECVDAEMESWDDLLDGNRIDIGAACRPL